MQQEPIIVAIEVANQVKELPEQYRVSAFKVILGFKLSQVEGTTADNVPGIIQTDMSFSEFYNQLPELKTNPQRFAAVAFYCERSRQETTVTQEDIASLMREAGLRPPANFTRDMGLATSSKNALLMDAREPKNGKSAWQITRTGRQFIEQALGKKSTVNT